jgi:hypothetical protein
MDVNCTARTVLIPQDARHEVLEDWLTRDRLAVTLLWDRLS